MGQTAYRDNSFVMDSQTNHNTGTGILTVIFNESKAPLPRHEIYRSCCFCSCMRLLF